ncbi:MAG: acetylornithine aminotransferase [Candidatus Azotimanducaceae bacterium]|jgi:acetylornithine aminotransferase
MTESLMKTYGRMDVAFTKGEGAWLIDEDGKRYLDALAGLGVTALGHSDAEVTKTISEQASQLMHTSNIYRIPAQEQLADLLASITGMDNMFFGNSGAEANECAIKISRLHGTQNGISQPTIIVADASFHGRTMATLTASGSRKVHAGFEPLVNGFVRAPFNDVEAIENIAKNNSSIVAVMVEPIQGEGGIQIPNAGYLQALRKICDDNNWFLILDEVQTGNGRTGTYFNYMQSGIVPDLLTTAKGLANGIPIGVCLAKGKAAKVFVPGNHGSTFGGNPFACSVALTVVKQIQERKLPERAAELGKRIQDRFRAKLAGLNCVKDIRGTGLMIGVELDAPCPELTAKAKNKGLLINVTSGNVIRLLPPLVISDEEADQIVDIVCELIEEI